MFISLLYSFERGDEPTIILYTLNEAIMIRISFFTISLSIKESCQYSNNKKEINSLMILTVKVTPIKKKEFVVF